MADQRQVEENYTPLRVRRASVEKHYQFLQDKLDKVLPLVGGKYFLEAVAVGGAVADLSCSNFRGERANRERGINVPVAPLLEAEASEVRYWMSLHQEWREDLTPGSQKLVYYTTALTIFFGDAGDLDKLQLFRAEWAGVRTQSVGIFSFEAPGAGHPHWQFDVYESRAGEVEKERRRVEELALALDDITKVEEFGEMVVAELSPESVISRDRCMRRLSTAHFASCANWSKFPWRGDATETRAHAQGPADTSEIENWVISTVVYITKELNR